MSDIATAKVIDLHAHAVLEETMGAAGSFGPEMGDQDSAMPWFRVGSYRLNGVRYKGGAYMDPVLRIQRMDKAGIDFQVLSPNPLTYMHFIPPAEAIRFCRRHNDALAALVKKYPHRLAGLASLPVQDPAAAKDELVRSVQELGLWGGYVGTDSPRPLDDPAFDPLYETCVKLDVPLFIHPGPAGIDGPPGDPNLKRFDLSVVVGFAAQETIAIATLIFGGVLERHPEIDICMSNGGGAAAFMRGRMVQAGLKRPWAPERLKKDGAFEAELSRLWYDNHLNDDESLKLLISIVGTDRLVYGTNFAGWDAPGDTEYGEVPLYLADNARRLLRRQPAAARKVAAGRHS
jgi:aminocarboxymuconate-semialdehyde decarboxylase